jgi:signal transduction histidine kinase
MNTRRESSPQTRSSTEIVSALADFARLAQQMLVASTPGTLEAGIAAALRRLLALCNMQQGALLLATRYPASPKQSFWPPLSERDTLRVLARQSLDDQLFALLATFTGNEDIQLSSSEPGWMICQQLLPVPGSSHQAMPISAESLPVPLSSTQSFFFLGKTETAYQSSRQAMREKHQQLWSQVADAVGMVIVSLLQAEQMHELETATSHRDLQQMELLKAELLATVSHELRSPLASIKGYAATLLRHDRRISREERLEFLLAIHDASQHIELVIDRLLEMSQLETETLPIQHMPVDLTYVVREAITAREQHPGETNASVPATAQQLESIPHATRTFTLRIEDSDGHPTNKLPLVQADRHLLREAVDHLLENAMLYSPAGETVEVGLRTRRPDQVSQLSHLLAQTAIPTRKAIVWPPSWPSDQPMVELWIQDHGIGIEEAHLEQIFHRFYRVDTSLTREVNGLGLGLAICKQIVALHHGLLWAESSVGKGSTFHVLLPINGPTK